MKKIFLPLFLSQGLRSAGVSLLSFFSAVYIYKQTLSLLVVFSFFLLLYIFKIIGVGVAENLALKFGLKKQIILSYFLTGLAILAFVSSQNNFSLLWLAAPFWGAANGFFWFGRHGLLLKISEREIYGQAAGEASAFNNLALLIAPFLGGVLINQFDYRGLFWGALTFIFLGMLSLTPLKEEKTHQDVSFKEVIRLLVSHGRMALAYFAVGGIGAIYSTALVLYIFSLVKGEIAMGEFFSLSLLFVALIHWLTGIWVDKKRGRKLLRYGAIASFLVWIARILLGGIIGLFILDIIDRMAGGMVGIPLEALSFQKAVDGQSTGRALLFRETAIGLGSVFACLLLLLFVFLNLPLSFSFLLAAGLSLFLLLGKIPEVAT